MERGGISFSCHRRIKKKIYIYILRRVKAPKSQSLFYGVIGSQVCQDLLDQAKANRPPKIQKVSKAHKGSKVSKLVLWRDRMPSILVSARPSEDEQTTKDPKRF